MSYFFRIFNLINNAIFACAKCPALGLFELICNKTVGGIQSSVVSVNGVNSLNSEKLVSIKSFQRKCKNGCPPFYLMKPQ